MISCEGKFTPETKKNNKKGKKIMIKNWLKILTGQATDVSSTEINDEYNELNNEKQILESRLIEIRGALLQKKKELLGGMDVGLEIQDLEFEAAEAKDRVEAITLAVSELKALHARTMDNERDSRVAEITQQIADLRSQSVKYRIEYLKHLARADAYRCLMLQGAPGNMLGQQSQTILYTGYERKDYYAPFYDEILKDKEFVMPQIIVLMEERKNLLEVCR